MTKLEKKLFAWVQKYETILSILFCLAISLALRYCMRGGRSVDMRDYLLPWMQQLQEAGGLAGLRQPIGEYNVPYMTILAVLSYLPEHHWITAVKVVSVLFDLICAGLVVCIARQLGSRIPVSVLLTASLMAPQVVFNGAVWGQCDALYTACLLACALFLLQKRYGLCWLFWGFALGFKLQALFYFPALFILYILGQAGSIFWIGMAAAAFLIGLVPALLAGRPLLDTLTIYLTQVGLYNDLTMGMPNFYDLVTGEIPVLSPFGKVFAAGLLLLFAMWMYLNHPVLNDRQILLLFATTSLLAVFFLPHMHERYNYPIFFFLLAAAAVWKPAIWLALAQSLTTTLSYSSFLFTVSSPVPSWVLALVNLATVLYCVWELLSQRAAAVLPDAAETMHT